MPQKLCHELPRSRIQQIKYLVNAGCPTATDITGAQDIARRWLKGQNNVLQVRLILIPRFERLLRI